MLEIKRFRKIAFENIFKYKLNEQLLSINIVGSTECLITTKTTGELDLLFIYSKVNKQLIDNIYSYCIRTAESFWDNSKGNILVEMRRGPFKTKIKKYQMHAIILDLHYFNETELGTLIDWNNKSRANNNHNHIYGKDIIDNNKYIQKDVTISATKIIKQLDKEFHNKSFNYLEIDNFSDSLKYIKKNYKWVDNDLSKYIFCKYIIQVSITMNILSKNMNKIVTKDDIKSWLKKNINDGFELYNNLSNNKLINNTDLIIIEDILNCALNCMNR